MPPRATTHHDSPSPRTTARPAILVVGYGHLGEHLAGCLANKKVTVTIIDRDREAFSNFSRARQTRCLVGDPMEPELLERANISEADVLIAATGQDECNAALAVTAQKLFGVQHAIARVRNPDRAGSLSRLGMEPVCPTTLEAEAIASHVDRASPERIVVVGCGRVGSRVVQLLSKEGHRVAVIDPRAASFEHLPESLGHRIAGDATDWRVLERAGVREAGWVMAATHEDKVNLMVALMARRALGIKHVVARVHDPRHQALLEQVSTVSSTILSAKAVLRIVGGWVDGAPWVP